MDDLCECGHRREDHERLLPHDQEDSCLKCTANAYHDFKSAYLRN